MDQKQSDDREKQIYHAARSIADVNARQQYLEEECGADEELWESVNSLLLAADVAGDFLEKPLVDSEPDVESSSKVSEFDGMSGSVAVTVNVNVSFSLTL